MNSKSPFKALALAAASVAVAATLAACSSSSGGGTNTKSIAQNETPGTIGGWTPPAGSIPTFDCKDNSYANAVKKGITIGATAYPPFFSRQGSSYTGIDYTVLSAMLKYIGVAKVNITFASSFDTLIPSLISKRIDIVGFSLHENPDRLKQIGFTSGAYWYGPVLVVRKGNPKHLMTFSDLNKPGLRIGAVSGIATADYLQQEKIKTTLYKDPTSELAALNGGREDVVVEESPTVYSYQQAQPNAQIEVLTAAVPTSLLATVYSYGRYSVRKADCSLNWALSRAADELRINGAMANILKPYAGSGIKVNQTATS